MVKVCCVKSCKEFWHPKTHLSFFAFPFNNEEMKEKWLNAAPGYKSLSKHSSICSDHFLPDDYNECLGKRRLKKNSVPSVFGPKCPNGCPSIPDSIIINEQECSLSAETNMIQKPQIIHLLGPGVQLVATPQTPLSIFQSLQKHEVLPKRFASVSVQTCPRLSGPSEREKELTHKIRILQNRLRRREKMITNAKELVTHLKKAGKPENLEDKFLEKFTKFDLELFKNEANNNNVAKNSKTYTQEMKDFAMTLYSYSPRAYKFVRAKINLPHTATLRRWIAEAAGSPKEIEIGNEQVSSNELEETESTEMEDVEYTEIEELEYTELEEVESTEIEEVESAEIEEVESAEIDKVESTEIEEEEESVEMEELEYDEMEQADCIEIEETKFLDVKENLVTCRLPVLVALPVNVSETDSCNGTTTTPISSRKQYKLKRV